MNEGEARPADEADAVEGDSEGRDRQRGDDAERGTDESAGPKPDDNAERGTDESAGPKPDDNAERGTDESAGPRTCRENEQEGGANGTGPEAEAAASADRKTARKTAPKTARQTASSGRARRTVRAVVRSAIALLSVASLGITGYAYSALDALQDNVTTTDALRLNDVIDTSEDEPPPPEDDGATDILLVGTDSRTDMEGNPLPADVLRQLRTESNPGISTDTLIVLRIPHDGSSPTGISIPRDTWVSVSGGDHAKINSVYGSAKYEAERALRAEGVTERSKLARESDQAGRSALVRTVQRFTQVRIDHYAEVNLLGFYLLTEALGGVKVCLNNATSDPDSGANFAAGVQTVSGGEALSFVRQRKNLPRGDLDRIQRQQAFLASALNKVLSAGTLTDTERMEKLSDTLRKSLVLDSELDLLKFAQQTSGIASGEFSFVTIPVVDIAAWSPDGKQSIVAVDLDEVRSFVADAVRDDSREERPSGGGSAPPAARSQQTGAEEITADDVACVN
ncbi:LCP family protein [Saccharomonospora xinjiangensis]|uniref:LCP family protein n=1 Tax=Saccharomonospora xinjiangensis TaxID=75294 RepID=UPI00107032F2|nr:LCP family protein [Saccharomonospora xinjiangensis]QBQ59060.1 Transcriptional regulator LytR [Saccharomonospora xinjiangensis]